ncbi:uncharacterized protein LY89DRAFT_743308 [Mollisia scopiformis]|uniref:Uncharacterized protein n=1 Tax=Mollisia scopiformis TaxID=149040 RepID=A0A132B3J8_MOLSC|nr:uncharacterized protein LY89DRAFT_743308 [Mollisia scopiformis]KUJ06978.1 hypothetical protein LY89DRAFT_743308 [Mollisia scopiformis]
MAPTDAVQIKSETFESSSSEALTRITQRSTERLSPSSKVVFRRFRRHASSMMETQAAGESCWELLEQEYPDHLECYYCRDMHSMDEIHKYATGSAESIVFSDPCWKMNSRVRTATFIHPNFSFTVFRMIMKRHRQGKNCDKELNLLAYRSGAVREGAQVKQIVAVPKIVDGRMFMRSQTIYVIPSKEGSQMYLVCNNLVECPHTDAFSRDNGEVTHRLYQRLAAIETIPRGRLEKVMSCQCRFCPTEFEINLQRFEGQSAVIVVNKWQDLGSGLSPLPTELPPVVGPSKVIRRARRAETQNLHPSPRAGSEDSQAVSTLEHKEVKEVFRKSNSMLARINKAQDSFWWGYLAAFGCEELPWQSTREGSGDRL